MANEFKVGDIVQLKSGGPKMTVQVAREGDAYVQCQWFAGSKLENGHFNNATLIQAPEGKAEKKD